MKKHFRVSTALLAAVLLAGCGSISSKDGGYYATESPSAEGAYDTAAGAANSSIVPEELPDSTDETAQKIIYNADINMESTDFDAARDTLLAAVDSSVGGKTAIDLGETKNIVGAFWQPKVVLVDFDALATLPRRHFVNGLAEAIKAGLIADPELFALFECEHPEENIERIIYRSLRVKKNVVENDEHEQGQRACLNFGHTIGHGIEAVKGVRGRRTNGLFHGECVALGMLPMIEDKSLVRRTRAIYRTLGLPTRTGVDKNKVLSYMQHDKKSAGSTITVIKVPGLGCWRADKIPMTELPALLGIKENED